ncbi:MAG: Cys-Gln thioester bond-forming surface protein [Oscillospiraceae bacterium]
MQNTNWSTFWTPTIFQDPDNRKHLQAIAENGYWGTASGQGSLSEVKKLVDSRYWNDIDDGIALAVTQAAIWTYGNRNGETLGGNNFNNPKWKDRPGSLNSIVCRMAALVR